MKKLLYNLVLITCLVSCVVTFECTKAEYKCDDGSCVKINSECDGHKDCLDGSDEKNCDRKLCESPKWYQCADKKTCISSQFVCDTEDNCPDGDDELNCSFLVHKQKKCSKYEYTCPDKRCIPLDFVCDGKKDCTDGTDETVGCTNAEASCPGFFCTNKHCLESASWVCDGFDDCGDGSDEVGCVWNCKIEEKKFLCHDNDTCITLDRVCDGKDDCLDKSDEHGLCSKDSCDKKLCPAASTCKMLPTGAVCLCPKGFEYNEINHVCRDIDECEIFGICSQGCVNTIGSYNCICADKFTLNINNKTCTAGNGEPLLLYTTQKSVVGIYLHSHHMYKVADNLTQVIGVAYDGDHIYWTNIQHEYESIVRAREDGSKQEQLLTSGLDAPEDLAVDWLTGNIYFSDNVMRHIAACSNSGHYCTVLVVMNVDQPRGVALNPLKGVMFWTDWGIQPMIGRASMDGSNAKPIITNDIHWPNGIALDIPNDRLYWVDAKLGTIESTRMDGSDRKVIINDVLKHPYGIAIFEDNIYWSDWGTKSIHTCHKFTGKSHEIVGKDSTIYAVHIYHSALQPKVYNPCDTRGCTHLCLIAENNSSTCACPDGMNLALDHTRCVKSFKKQKLYLGIKNYLVEMEHTTFGRHNIAQGHGLPMFIHQMAYNNINGSIFIADNLQKAIFEFEPLQNKIKTILRGNIGNITALSFDHLAQNLYWADSERHTVEVISLRNNQRAIVHFFSGLDIPIAMTVIPSTGKMFVALHSGIHMHIDQRDMSGKDYHYHVFEELHGLGGGGDIEMKVDYDSNTLYWVDSQAGRIEFANMNRMQKLPFRTRLLQPISMAIVDEDLFWSIQGSSLIYWTHKSNLASIKKIEIETPKDSHDSGKAERITLLSSTPLLNIGHICLHRNGGCSHVCVSIGKDNSACLCPPGLVFSDLENRTCIEELDCEFRCNSGECFTMSRKCNGHIDCSDSSDEENCDKKMNEKVVCYYDEFPCRDGTQCVSNEVRCDQVANCKDKSDEDNCEHFDHMKKCHKHQFPCNNGRCVDLTTLCDSVDDCGDNSDEKNCSSSSLNGKKDSCGKNMFKCASGSCISKSWECDGKLDCPDGSDEHERCGVLKCADGFHKCKMGKCIDSKLLCDGHDDCGDSSDEIDCDASKREIICGDEVDTFGDPKKFQCSSEPTMCLDMKVRCNGTAECPKGEDEQGCNGCSIYEFQCKTSKECIRLEFRCDKEKDCTDGSDEVNCARYNSSTHHLYSTACQTGTFDCKDGTCIDQSRVCDEISDCENSEDELSLCKTACISSPCDHICNPSPYGSECSCHVGYKLTGNKRTCVDIDECVESHSCSQVCENSVGSYRCACFVDFMLRADKTTCKSMDSSHYVLFSTSNQLRKITDNPVTVEVMNPFNDSKIIGLDVNVWKNLSFILEDSDKLYAYDLEKKKLINSITAVGLSQISVDWITDNVYAIGHIGRYYIKVCNMLPAKCAQIIKFKRFEIVKALVVDPINRYLFYVVVHSNTLGPSKSFIYISGMDGSKQELLLLKEAYIVALEVDTYKKELYFIDNYSKTLQVLNYKNSKNLSRVVIRKSNAIVNPSGLSVYENFAYILNTGSREAVKCKLFGNSECEAFDVNVYNAQSLVIAGKSRQKMVNNECDGNKCSLICVRAELGPKCICPNGKSVQENVKCINSNESSDVAALYDSDESLGSESDHEHDDEDESSVGVVVAVCLTIIIAVLVAVFGYLFYQRKCGGGNFNVNMHFQNPLGHPGGQRIDSQFHEGKVSMGKPLQRNLPTGSKGSEIFLETKASSKPMPTISELERRSGIFMESSDNESTGDVGDYNDNPKARLVF